MPVKFKKLIGRITGIDTPIFGISWQPPKSEHELARNLLLFLADRRFLQTPFEKEDEQYVVRSVLETREKLGELLINSVDNSILAKSLAAMRAACREFLDNVQQTHKSSIQLGSNFIIALGVLRTHFGLAITRISVAYGIDLPDNLLRILPPQQNRDDKSFRKKRIT